MRNTVEADGPREARHRVPEKLIAARSSASFLKGTELSGSKLAVVDLQYARLLSDFAPVAIKTDAEHARALKTVGELMEKERRSQAETSLLKLLAVLIEGYEQDRFSMGEASPLESLQELMRARKMRPTELWDVFGSKGVASEVLNGKRGISMAMARKLGRLFHVPPAVFIDATGGGPDSSDDGPVM